MTFPITIKTFYGFEPLLAEEVAQIGAINIEQGNRVVKAEGTTETLYRANYELRTAVKVLAPVKYARVKNNQELYNAAKSIDWSQYFSYLDEFAVEATAFADNFSHSGFVALKVKDAIADQFRERKGKRPPVNKQDPKILINVHINKENLTIALDSSGDPLFKRGYKTFMGEAPVNEVLASGLLLFTGWQGNSDIHDFMCGSGTFLTEAAMIAHNLPANYYRKEFGFKNWRDFDAKLWRNITEQARKNKKHPDIKFFGSDINRKAISAAQKNIEPFYFRDKFDLQHKDFVEAKPANEEGMVITNPPYGQRLKQTDINNFYKQIGDHLKQYYPGHDAWILSNNNEAIKCIGLRSKKRITVYNGGMETKFLKFPLKSGKFS